jgi:RNA polymerase sigma factor (sigma-70 family)
MLIERTRAVLESLAGARPRLLRLALLRGVPLDMAEDVVQETLFEAWRCLDRLYNPSGIDRWLDEICRNICRRSARKYAVDLRHIYPPALRDGQGGEPDANWLEAIADEGLDDPADALSRQDTALLLDRALDMLPEREREVVDMCYLRELPQQEAAERLGISLSALEARLHRARRQLRDVFNGPLRGEAEAFGLALDDDFAEGWRETRLWCSLCGRRRLLGLFLPQPDGGVNLHMRCPDCEPRSGLCDIDGSSVHSKGLIRLDGLRSFRPAWKRTMQDTARRLMGALGAGAYSCPWCGAEVSLRLVEKGAVATTATPLPAGLERHPYQFWVRWRCPRQECCGSTFQGLFAASELVYWSHPATQRFMREHPHWVSEPELLVEYAGRTALRLQMADVTSAARLTTLADRETLRVLAIF